jgi:quercetin dioxygenase-like cupin family protein
VNYWKGDDLLGTTPDGRFRRIVVQETRVRGGTLSFAAGDRVEEHVHRESDEIFYGIAGRGRIVVEGETVEIGPGDLLFISGGERHTVEVDESAPEPFVIFAAVSPNSQGDTAFTAGR